MRRLVNSSALQSWKWQLIGMGYWYRGRGMQPPIARNRTVHPRCSTTDIPPLPISCTRLSPRSPDPEATSYLPRLIITLEILIKFNKRYVRLCVDLVYVCRCLSV